MSMGEARIAVIGAGLMGHGIAQVFALAGHPVAVTDSVEENLASLKDRIRANLRDLGDDENAVERVRAVPDLAAAVNDADFVVEAVSEDLPLKQKLFAEMETLAQPHCALTSNSSSFPISEIGKGLKTQGRMMGLHFFMPAHLIPLVEVVRSTHTDVTLAETVEIGRAHV